MKQLSIFDAIASQRARDAGIDLATLNEKEAWMFYALSVISDLKPGWTGIGEDIRKLVIEAGHGEPHHPNVWGALIMAATKRGYIARTGAMARAKAKKSHASTYPVLVRK